ncbi:migration and invasion-inhibitory protein isoform X4 [Loxodonta africana]|uniref:migration and invasion-inhibitory protein isoform X4 n=1 Tax=Loxodonta africana TaxID=9785 RepID=UPI0030D5DB5E
MMETEDLVQLRKLNLELLRQLWAGQDAVRRSVAEAASKSSRDSSSSHDAETPSLREMTSMASRASSPPSAHQDGTCDLAWPGRTSSLAVSLPPHKCQRQESLGPPRPRSAPLLVTLDLNDSELSAELGSPGPREALRSILTPRQSKPSKPRVTFSKEPAVPEWNWRLRPYLGYDWIAGSLDSTSPVTGKSEAFFSELQNFREANKEECISSDPEPQFLRFCESSDVDEDHECVYCYRVNRRLFLVPADPGTPCRLCRTQRGQRGPETLAEPAQVSIAYWAGISSLPSQRKAQHPGTWTSGPVSPPRPSIRSCLPLAPPSWHCQRGLHPLPRSG